MLELQATTEAGRALVALAERLADQFAASADRHDRDGTYPFEHLETLHETGYLVAPVPSELGGLGVESTSDLLIASSRLARGDASVVIGLNMHLIPLVNMASRWRHARAVGNTRREAAWERSLRAVVDERTVMAAAISEPGQILTSPRTVARRDGGDWVVDGHKVFCTMSPAATLFYTAVTFTDDDGAQRYGYAQIPSDTPGVTVNDDWDALGMRASGSGSVSFESVRLPAGALRGGFPIGRFGASYMERNLVAGAFHAATGVGIAESAHESVAGDLSRRADLDGRARMLLAQNAVELGAVRALLARTGALLDVHALGEPAKDDDGVTALFAEVQSAKAFINEAAVRIVDRALALTGGAGYLSRHPLSRAYRDVRAGAFMHPLGANRAFDLLADVALGREPSLR